jgi:hypothetical protein
MPSGREEMWVVSKDGIMTNKGDARMMSKESISPTKTPREGEAPASPGPIDVLKSAQVLGKMDKGKESLASEEPEGKQHVRFFGPGLDGAAEEEADHRGPMRLRRRRQRVTIKASASPVANWVLSHSLSLCPAGACRVVELQTR